MSLDVLNTLESKDLSFTTRAHSMLVAVRELDLDQLEVLMAGMAPVTMYGLVGALEGFEQTDEVIGAIIGLLIYEHSPEIVPHLMSFMASGKATLREVVGLTVKNSVSLCPHTMRRGAKSAKLLAYAAGVAITYPKLVSGLELPFTV